MQVTEEMYLALFNGISDAIELLDAKSYDSVRTALIDAQLKAEALCINID